MHSVSTMHGWNWFTAWWQWYFSFCRAFISVQLHCFLVVSEVVCVWMLSRSQHAIWSPTKCWPAAVSAQVVSYHWRHWLFSSWHKTTSAWISRVWTTAWPVCWCFTLFLSSAWHLVWACSSGLTQCTLDWAQLPLCDWARIIQFPFFTRFYYYCRSYYYVVINIFVIQDCSAI